MIGFLLNWSASLADHSGAALLRPTAALVFGLSLSYSQTTHGLQAQATKAKKAESKVVCVDGLSKPLADLPMHRLTCAEQEFRTRGKPVMAAAIGGISIGVSTSPANPTKISVWVDNQTAGPYSYYVCCRLSFLKEFSVFNSTGQLLLPKEEQRARRFEATDQPRIEVCSCSTWINVAPHTMQVVDSGDLTDDSNGYELSSGTYFIAPRDSQAKEPGPSTKEQINKQLAHQNSIRVVISGAQR